ncbi:MAG: hypothetical protein HBSAPP03_05840 [Phycisphaerae bacterium]|nr:MAG: hypothetical protein HBSAPP03_05840 [Phycisphaerae bacterium]
MSSETLAPAPSPVPATTPPPGIACRNLGKRYHIYARPQDRLKQALLRWTGKRYYHDFWAVRGVGFDVAPGESVGIIGRNGSGKSTLLQMIAGTLTPTEGSVTVRGRVAALLELGSGFNPEFTGRENVYMNGAILGISKAEMHARFDAIAAFADIGEFLDQPVKTYSSGMHLRLAFAVAASVDPEVLIVDEALAVGDLLFQAKCTARLRRLLDAGTTLLLVSHSLDAVRSLCRKAVWMEQGQVVALGPSKDVTERYASAMHVEHNAATVPDALATAEDAPEAEAIRAAAARLAGPNDPASPIRVRRVALTNAHGRTTEALTLSERFAIEVELASAVDLDHISVGIIIKDRHGLELTGESVFNTLQRGVPMRADRPITVRFEAENNLRPDDYHVAVRVNRVTRWDRSDNVLFYADDAAAAFRSLADPDRPLWFRYKHPFKVTIS